MEILGLNLKGIGSEGVILITLFLIVKHLLIPMYKELKHKLNEKRGLANDTLRRLNPNDLTLGKLHQAVKDHEKWDDKRTQEIKDEIKELRKDIRDHGERLAGLEAIKH